jgi:hypothetical protein
MLRETAQREFRTTVPAGDSQPWPVYTRRKPSLGVS